MKKNIHTHTQIKEKADLPALTERGKKSLLITSLMYYFQTTITPPLTH